MPEESAQIQYALSAPDIDRRATSISNSEVEQMRIQDSKQVTVSMLSLFQVNHQARRLWLMRCQSHYVCIAPFGNAYHFSIMSVCSRNLDQFQDVQSPRVEKKRMMSKQFAELGGCRMIFGKNLCWKLS